MKKSLFPLLWLLPTFVLAADTFTPTIPVRGKPTLLSYKEYPVKLWKDASTNTFPWFVEKPDGWCIDWDAERTNLTMLVVHHSAGTGVETPEEISDTILKQVYGDDKAFYSPYRDQNNHAPDVFPKQSGGRTMSLPFHSSHMVDGKETFTAYHFLVYPNGKVLTTLAPHREVNGKLMVDMIGWGAGNWKVNCSSVQVCLLGTFTKKNPPPKEQLESLEKIIGFYRSKVPGLQILPHKGVRDQPTECPGSWFSDWFAAYLLK